MPALKRIGAAALSAFGFGQGGATTVTANYLIVAGGAAGGSSGANFGTSAGGGAGGYQASTASLNTTLSYTVIVGAGGATAAYDTVGTNGSNSSITNITASVGGGGGGAGSNKSGNSGGSSGGSVQGFTPSAATSGQGNIGGTGSGSGANYGCGGGGGSGSVGANGTSSAGGNGGSGTASSISGSSVTYSGGGGGGTYNGGTPGTGGSGGGGNGNTSGGVGYNGTANTGGGGGGTGGTSGSSNAYGGQGGSGIVIISYTGAQQFGGGVVTTAAGNTIHTFYTSGTLSPLSSLSASYLVVAGGGGAGGPADGYTNNGAGGGGAGGFLTSTGLAIDTNSTYVVTVGAGGAGAQGASGAKGSNSTFFSVTAEGGGFGAINSTGGNGGSGGGGGWNSGTGGTATSGQGNNGGSGIYVSPTFGGGGGGGAGAVGANCNSSSSGAGGAGLSSSISGTSVTYAGGGGGGSLATAGAGGSGGGGAGGSRAAGTAGTVNLGGGGGGGAPVSDPVGASGGSGGSGIVIISYAGSTQQMAGGTVTVSGGNVIHTFTSSGYLSPLTNFGNSLRFRSSASAYLSRTPTVASNRKTWTWSGWVKRGAFNAGIFQGFSGGNLTSFAFGGTGNVTLFVQDYTSGSYNLIWETSAVFRDPAAWYHFVCAYDTTQASSANAVKIYVNGVQQTLTFTAANGSYSQNRDSYVNATNAQNIGTYSGVANYQDGYMTNINFIDGQALGPNSFGSFNQYGVWIPVTYGGSYGTNGYFLPFIANQSGYSGSFSGSNYLALTDSSNTMDLGSSTSLEFFYYPTSLANLQGLFMKGGGGNSWSTSNGIYYDVIFTTSGIFTTTYNAGGSAGTIADTTARALNRWYHVVLATNSTTISLFVNGVRVATATAVPTKPTTRTTVDIGTTFAGGENALGLISNMRFISGANAYDAAATRITVPTTTLTAVTGTQLLTLQNSTIIDNSTNGFTITNTGSVTTGQTYPLATTVFNDQSPQGNNWTPNNISGNIGSTLDYMVDVPTLSNATSSNYCVLNPLALHSGTGSLVISNGNLRVGCSQASMDNDVVVQWPSYTGKWYWEVTITNGGSFSSGNGLNIGLNKLDGSLSAYRWISSTGSPVSTTYGTGDVLGFAYDADAGTIGYYKNNVLAGTSTGVPTGLAPTCYIWGSNASAVAVDFNFGQQPWKYTPPSGYVALNTYNM